MSVVAYARVSTYDKEPALQINTLMAEGYDVAFTDKASAADRDRPELEKAIAYLRHGDVLLFWKLDRLARSGVHLGQIAETVRSKGAHLKCIVQPVDTTFNGRLTFDLLACFAEFERDVILERTMAGLKAARAQGRIGGWKKGRPRKKKNIRAVKRGDSHKDVAHDNKDTALHRHET